jgi:hypothetical protein
MILDLSVQQVFPRPYLLAPWSELDFPYVQIEALNKVHNFGTQCFVSRTCLSLRIFGVLESFSSWSCTCIGLLYSIETCLMNFTQECSFNTKNLCRHKYSKNTCICELVWSWG